MGEITDVPDTVMHYNMLFRGPNLSLPLQDIVVKDLPVEVLEADDIQLLRGYLSWQHALNLEMHYLSLAAMVSGLFVLTPI
jgi:hypothetical protein